MTQNRKKVASIAGVAICCCTSIFIFCRNYILRHQDETPPSWFGYVCGFTVIVGMISFAVLVTSVAFGLFERKERDAGDHFID